MPVGAAHDHPPKPPSFPFLPSQRNYFFVAAFPFSRTPTPTRERSAWSGAAVGTVMRRPNILHPVGTHAHGAAAQYYQATPGFCSSSNTYECGSWYPNHFLLMMGKAAKGRKGGHQRPDQATAGQGGKDEGPCTYQGSTTREPLERSSTSATSQYHFYLGRFPPCPVFLFFPPAMTHPSLGVSEASFSKKEGKDYYLKREDSISPADVVHTTCE